MKEIIIFPFDLSSEFRDEDYIQGREMDLLQPGFIIGPKSFCSSTKIWSQYGHSQSEKKWGVRDKYNRSIKVHT